MSSSKRTIVSRFRRGVLVGLALSAFVYLAYALATGAEEVLEALSRFRWSWLAPLLLLSLGNYGIRYLRWEYYLRRLSIRIPWTSSALIFFAGLAMTVTPGKVGELLKSYLLKRNHGVPIRRSVPIVFVERVSDLLALLLLASLGVASFGGPGAQAVLIAGGLLVGAIIAVLQSRPLTRWSLQLVARLPRGDRISSAAADAIEASRSLLSLRPLLLALLLASTAWYLECLEYWVAFQSFGTQATSLPVAVFAYSFSTVAGAVSPGGLGPTDIGLIELALQFSPELEREVATAAAFVVRLCTLWFAVALGALALLRFGALIDIDLEQVTRDDRDPG